MPTFEKFGQNYELFVQTSSDGTGFIVRPPTTLEIDIRRNSAAGQNVAQFRVYNLSKTKADSCRFSPGSQRDFQPVSLRAGYGDNMPIIFTGNIQNAWTVREGVDMVTQIEIYDGGFDFTVTEAAIQSGATESQRQLLKRMMSIFKYVKPGVVGGFDDKPRGRSASYSGNLADILRELTGGGFFVDNEVAHCLKTNEYLAKAGPVRIVNAATGLLNSPILQGRKSDLLATFDMIFEPSLAVGEAVYIDAPFTGSQYKGIYKILGVSHHGVISGAVGKSVITTGTFYFTKALLPVTGI